MNDQEPVIEIPADHPDESIVEVPITQARNVPENEEAEAPTSAGPTSDDKYSAHELRIQELERRLVSERPRDDGSGSGSAVGHGDTSADSPDTTASGEAQAGTPEGQSEQNADIGPAHGPGHFWFKRPGGRN